MPLCVRLRDILVPTCMTRPEAVPSIMSAYFLHLCVAGCGSSHGGERQHALDGCLKTPSTTDSPARWCALTLYLSSSYHCYIRMFTRLKIFQPTTTTRTSELIVLSFFLIRYIRCRYLQTRTYTQARSRDFRGWVEMRIWGPCRNKDS